MRVDTSVAGTVASTASGQPIQQGSCALRGHGMRYGVDTSQSQSQPRPMKRKNIVSPCGLYRYVTWADWRGLFDEVRPPVGTKARVNDLDRYVVFIGGRPMPDYCGVHKRYQDFASAWGYTAMAVVNLFAAEVVEDADLFHLDDDIGPDNDRHIKYIVRRAELAVACWGAFGLQKDRGLQVQKMLTSDRYPTLQCLSHLRSKFPIAGQPTEVLKLKMSQQLRVLRPLKSRKEIGVRWT